MTMEYESAGATRRVLVIEHAPELSHRLVAAGYHVEIAHSPLRVLSQMTENETELVVLDADIPRFDGLEVCRQLRTAMHYVPILMLKSRASELDRVLGLAMGADDYVDKTCSVTELLARMQAILRRIDGVNARGHARRDVLEAHALHIDIERHAVVVREKPIELTALEFDLLVFFARHPGRVYTRAQLLEHVWGYNHDGYAHTVSSHINRLRAKLELDPTHPRYVLTVRGIGYKFAETNSLPSAERRAVP